MIGKLDRRITIEERTLSKDAYGENTESWSTKWTLWAEVEKSYGGVSNKEEFEAKQHQSLSELIFRIRYKSAVTAYDHRVKFNGKTYDINEVREDYDAYRATYMKLVCDAR